MLGQYFEIRNFRIQFYDRLQLLPRDAPFEVEIADFGLKANLFTHETWLVQSAKKIKVTTAIIRNKYYQMVSFRSQIMFKSLSDCLLYVCPPGSSAIIEMFHCICFLIRPSIGVLVFVSSIAYILASSKTFSGV